MLAYSKSGSKSMRTCLLVELITCGPIWYWISVRRPASQKAWRLSPQGPVPVPCTGQCPGKCLSTHALEPWEGNLAASKSPVITAPTLGGGNIGSKLLARLHSQYHPKLRIAGTSSVLKQTSPKTPTKNFMPRVCRLGLRVTAYRV